MARDPRRGDRQRRIDERNVFLDLLLAARERLYLSYTGQQRARQLAAAAVGPGRGTARLLRRGHRRRAVLAGFAAAARARGSSSSIRCSRSRSTTSSRRPIRACAASTTSTATALKQQLAAPPADRTGAPSRCATRERRGDDDPRPATRPRRNEAREPQDRSSRCRSPSAGAGVARGLAGRLARFFRNPCRYLLRERLGIVAPGGDEELQDDEPFVPDVPARSALAQRVLPRLLAGEAVPSCSHFARAGIEYPAGRLGDARARSRSCSASTTSRARSRRCSRSRRSIPSARRWNSRSTASRGA